VVRYWHGYLPAAGCKLLWPPCVADADIIFLSGFFLLSFFFFFGPADATATPSSLAPVKSRGGGGEGGGGGSRTACEH